MSDPQLQPRTYRVRVFAPDAEVLTRHNYVAVLNFAPGPDAAQTELELDRMLKTLAALDNPAKASGASGYHLKITDVETGETFTWLTH